MAIGDTVSTIFNATTAFQPAAGVQILITALITTGNYLLEGLGDINTAGGDLLNSDGNAGGYGSSYRTWINTPKFFIDNSSYLNFSLFTAGYAGFTGIQTQ